ncbi:hypothetical protein ACHAWO_010667 [Cyclotella atomus]|uniref:FAD-binding domain-containing protein n=1 Tax=Cyclotella atomus TaxID=382360 RepID=A0ABD3PS63_9STRA
MTIARRSFYFINKCSSCVLAATIYPTYTHPTKRCASTANETDNKLRIAIVGGGAAGMTTALHLAPLVSAGVISGPIDVYEASSASKYQKVGGGRQSHPGSGSRGRDIGVGIWSTAWKPFLRSLEKGLGALDGIGKEKNRQSYIALLKDLEMCGSYVKEVGYRTPDGSWLVQSELNARPYGVEDVLSGKSKDVGSDDPALLFVREKDLLSCLRNAIKIEKNLGTIALHTGVRVNGIDNISGDMGSLVCSNATENNETGEEETSSKPYHLIIAADGLNSTLRSRYAGHHSMYSSGMGSSQLYGINRKKATKSANYEKWEHTTAHRQITQVEDRDYIVFRGNAPKLQEDGSGSFQTWGEKKSMRFAAVPFRHALDDEDNEENDNAREFRHDKSKWFEKKDDKEVWFATINDEGIYETYRTVGTSLNAEERKQLLLDAFGSWHKPVRTLIETTPADEILYEIAVSHRFNASPVFDVSSIVEFEHKCKGGATGRVNGRGPALVFIGDSMMTVDPVLAQGFTIAMESGASIVQSLERVIKDQAISNPSDPLCYQPDILRKEMKERHSRTEHRILSLLRSTELVQQLAQPHGFVSSTIATKIVRPMMKICPDGLKKAIFGCMIKYSLGLTGAKDNNGR